MSDWLHQKNESIPNNDVIPHLDMIVPKSEDKHSLLEKNRLLDVSVRVYKWTSSTGRSSLLQYSIMVRIKYTLCHFRFANAIVRLLSLYVDCQY